MLLSGQPQDLPDGRLWFANGVVLQMIDPGHQSGNALPPPVHVEGLIADRKNYSPRQDLRLPPRTRDLEIDYTALSFVVPQKVRFRYRLEGRDAAWQEPGTRRQAFYSDLRPRRYQFRVIACNNDVGRATQEGRAALNSLRTATTQTNDLAEALRRVTEDSVIPGSMAVTFSVVGDAREMHPIVRDEIYRIGYEAIHNACTHSGASRLEVELRYANDLAPLARYTLL